MSHVEFHVEVVPPECYKNANQEQDFTIVLKDPRSLQRLNGYPSFCVLGARVSEQPVRIAYAESAPAGGIPASNSEVVIVDSSTYTSEQKKQAKAFRKYEVPVVMHYEKTHLKITATAVTGSQRTLLWEDHVPVCLDNFFGGLGVDNYWPKKSSVWEKDAGNSPVVYAPSTTMEEMVKQPHAYVGPTYAMHSAGAKCCVRLELQRVVNAAGSAESVGSAGQPMGFYIDRVWAMRTIAIFSEESMFMA
jgi:hypothetical protein